MSRWRWQDWLWSQWPSQAGNLLMPSRWRPGDNLWKERGLVTWLVGKQPGGSVVWLELQGCGRITTLNARGVARRLGSLKLMNYNLDSLCGRIGGLPGVWRGCACFTGLPFSASKTAALSSCLRSPTHSWGILVCPDHEFPLPYRNCSSSHLCLFPFCPQSPVPAHIWVLSECLSLFHPI